MKNFLNEYGTAAMYGLLFILLIAGLIAILNIVSVWFYGGIMKEFLEEYGAAVVSCVAVIIIIAILFSMTFSDVDSGNTLKGLFAKKIISLLERAV